jgi:hypothetical protein
VFQNVSHHFLLLNAVLCIFEQDFLIFVFSIISAVVGICIHVGWDLNYAQLNDLLSVIHYSFFLNTALCLFQYNFPFLTLILLLLLLKYN